MIYTVAEVSRLLGVNRNKVYDLINSGLIKTIKFGRTKITNESLQSFLSTYDGYNLDDLNNIYPVQSELDNNKRKEVQQ